ncbi:MAG: hypothetical protein V1821_02485, partial [bacterium]
LRVKKTPEEIAAEQVQAAAAAFKAEQGADRFEGPRPKNIFAGGYAPDTRRMIVPESLRPSERLATTKGGAKSVMDAAAEQLGAGRKDACYNRK